MRVTAIRYTRDVAAVVRFYQALGLDLGAASRPGGWVELPAASGMVAVHQADSDNVGQCELAFESDEPLAQVAARLRDAGYEAGPVIDENYGQSLRLRDPDGVWVQINLSDRELYT